MRSIRFFSCFFAMLLMASFRLLADALVDDFEGGPTNQDKFGYYWYFYDDHKDGGNSTIPGVTKKDTNFIVAPTAGVGHAGACLVLPYSLGPIKAGAGAGYNYIGCGAMLAANLQSVDLTGAKTVTFWLKGSVATGVDFQLATLDIADFSYWHYIAQVTTSWQQFTVTLAGTGLGALARPTWATSTATFATSLSKVGKLQWQMHTDNVGTNTSGTIYLDDVWITGYTFIPFDLCTTCIGAPGSGTGALLSNMDVLPYNRNARCYYWYCYNDAAGRGALSAGQYSAITAGATPGADPTMNTITIGPTWPKGYLASNGADIQFTLGQTYTNTGSTDVIKPFVGIGTNLWDSTTAAVYNATADGATGVYFDYMLSGSDTNMVLRCEMYANVLAVAGSVHYIDLPYTGASVWKGATVLFSKLVQPKWGTVTPETFNPTIMKKLQWAVQNSPSTTGELAIDNVYMVGASKITSTCAGVLFQVSPNRSFNGFTPSLLNNNLKVIFNKGMSNASISLVNTRGAIVAKNMAANNLPALLNVSGLSKGVYMLVVKANSKTGAFKKTVPLTIY